MDPLSKPGSTAAAGTNIVAGHRATTANAEWAQAMAGAAAPQTEPVTAAAPVQASRPLPEAELAPVTGELSVDDAVARATTASSDRSTDATPASSGVAGAALSTQVTAEADPGADLPTSPGPSLPLTELASDTASSFGLGATGHTKEDAIATVVQPQAPAPPAVVTSAAPRSGLPQPPSVQANPGSNRGTETVDEARTSDPETPEQAIASSPLAGTPARRTATAAGHQALASVVASPTLAAAPGTAATVNVSLAAQPVETPTLLPSASPADGQSAPVSAAGSSAPANGASAAAPSRSGPEPKRQAVPAYPGEWVAATAGAPLSGDRAPGAMPSTAAQKPSPPIVNTTPMASLPSPLPSSSAAASAPSPVGASRRGRLFMEENEPVATGARGAGPGSAHVPQRRIDTPLATGVSTAATAVPASTPPPAAGTVDAAAAGGGIATPAAPRLHRSPHGPAQPPAAAAKVAGAGTASAVATPSTAVPLVEPDPRPLTGGQPAPGSTEAAPARVAVPTAGEGRLPASRPILAPTGPAPSPAVASDSTPAAGTAAEAEPPDASATPSAAVLLADPDVLQLVGGVGPTPGGAAELSAGGAVPAITEEGRRAASPGPIVVPPGPALPLAVAATGTPAAKPAATDKAVGHAGNGAQSMPPTTVAATPLKGSDAIANPPMLGAPSSVTVAEAGASPAGIQTKTGPLVAAGVAAIGTPAGATLATSASSPAAPAPAPTPAPATPDAMAASIVAMYRSGQSSLVLHLDPPGLGSVSVHLALGSNADVNVLFVPTIAQTGHLLQTGLGDLRQAMAASGLTLGQAQIGGGASGGPGGGNSSGSNPGTQSGPSSRIPVEALTLAEPAGHETANRGARAIA